MYLKKNTVLLIYHFLLVFSLSAQSNPTCDGKRYLSNIFNDFTKKTVQFGENVNLSGDNQKLYMDIYEPKGDTVSKRPVVVLAFGGGFAIGSRTDDNIVGLCKGYVARGFVAVSIDYRLISLLILVAHGDSAIITNDVIMAVQDMKASIRYLVKDSRNEKTLRIDTNNIFVGGYSAGAITAMHTAYLDTTRNIPTWIMEIIRKQGGIDGVSGNAGQTYKIKGVISLSGGIYASDAFRPKDPAYISYHGTKDETVPYNRGKNIYNYYNDGDGSCSIQAKSQGITTLHTAVIGGGHSDIYNFSSPNNFPGQFDAFEAQEIVLMKKLVCGESLTDSNDIANDGDVEIFPNPSLGEINIKIPNENYFVKWRAELFDVTGKCHSDVNFIGNQFSFSENNLVSGIYFLRVSDESKKIMVLKKIQILNN